MANKNSDKVSSLFCKSKMVTRVCKSSKDTQTRADGKCVEDSVYFTSRLEKMLFGDYHKRIKVEIYIVSEPLIESIRSTKCVENKALCNEVGAMKEALLYGEVLSYSYIQSKMNPADKMMKMMKETLIFYNIFLKGLFMNDRSRKIIKLVEREHLNEIRLYEF